MKLTLTKDFFFGGRATFTVQNNQTGEHRTYKVKVTQPSSLYPFESIFISQMTGTDNEAHYSYIGKVNSRNGAIVMTRKSRFAEGSPVVKAARWIMGRIVNNLDWPDFFEVRHAGKCGRCGRTLTTPESLDRGIGPECWGKMGH